MDQWLKSGTLKNSINDVENDVKYEWSLNKYIEQIIIIIFN